MINIFNCDSVNIESRCTIKCQIPSEITLSKSLALSTNMGTFITLYSNRPLYSKGS